MALLMTQVQKCTESCNVVAEIPRISKKSMKESVNSPVKIYRYNGPKKPPMPKSASIKAIPALTFLASQAFSVWEANQSDF